MYLALQGWAAAAVPELSRQVVDRSEAGLTLVYVSVVLLKVDPDSHGVLLDFFAERP